MQLCDTPWGSEEETTERYVRSEPMRRQTERSYKSFRHSTMNGKRYTTSKDESLGHACSQQSLCQVTDLVHMSFLTNDLAFIFVLTNPEGEKNKRKSETMMNGTGRYKPQHYKHKVH